MSIMQSEAYQFRQFPMGPNLRTYLQLGDAYAGESTPRREPEDEARLTTYLRTHHDNNIVRLTGAQVVDLADELVTMDLPVAALELALRRPDDFPAHDFRAQLTLGVAAMLTGDLVASEAALRKAQAAMPEEPAPYVNLTQIFRSLGRIDEAEVWCLAGMDAEPNNLRLWDLLAGLYQTRFGEYLPEELLRVAEKRAAWAGLALAADLTTTGDRYFKANLLERLYAQGERDHQFLIELTGAYGVAGQFDRIPPLVWQAERASTKRLPWQLTMHGAQAQLALGLGTECLDWLAKLSTDSTLPVEARSALDDLKKEAEELVTHGAHTH